MSTSKTYSGNECGSGVLVSFDGVKLNIGENYTVVFSCVSRMPEGAYQIIPTGFNIRPSNSNNTLSAIFSANNAYTMYNSSSNIIKLSIFDNNNSEVHRDYTAIYCGNLSQDPVMPSVTPTPTATSTPRPTKTPAITPTPSITPTNTVTVTPSRTPPLGFSALFPQLVTRMNNCGEVTIYGTAKGKIGQSYTYHFSTDMNQGIEFSNPTGIITISNSSLSHDIYTSVTMKNPCENYSIKFGISNGQKTVESIGFFVCGNCP